MPIWPWKAQSRPNGNQFILRLPLKPAPAPVAPEEADFLKKALLNENIWDKLLSNG